MSDVAYWKSKRKWLWFMLWTWLAAMFVLSVPLARKINEARRLRESIAEVDEIERILPNDDKVTKVETNVWMIESLEFNKSERLYARGSRVTFTDDILTFHWDSSETPTKYKYVVDPSTTPWQIDLTESLVFMGEKHIVEQKGIIEFDGDRARMCFGSTRPESFSTKNPAGFDTAPNDSAVLIVLVRPPMR